MDSLLFSHNTIDITYDVKLGSSNASIEFKLEVKGMNIKEWLIQNQNCLSPTTWLNIVIFQLLCASCFDKSRLPTPSPHASFSPQLICLMWFHALDCKKVKSSSINQFDEHLVGSFKRWLLFLHKATYHKDSDLITSWTTILSCGTRIFITL